MTGPKPSIDFRYSPQAAFMGTSPVVGFGADDFYLEIIPKHKADALIVKHHYSHKVYAGSMLHFGVFIDGALLGVLQYGAAMNPASGGSVVDGTTIDTFLELNRMWMDDIAPRNTESRAIAYSMKLIRKLRPRTEWVQSFADERCGGLGIVYQAANFEYYGEHTSVFWELDGITYHNIAMTVRTRKNAKEQHLQNNRERAVSQSLRQFRYIYWIDRRAKKRVKLKQQPYPKHYEEAAANQRKDIDNGHMGSTSPNRGDHGAD